ncbi:glutamine synthetase family protein [Spirochaeta isovalerica]|uniref:Glutamine synthetase n=1 Tax=Spirochaeta isovalerica TaxID=150 RepID=A0A841REX2_9SPIO|nr:glutamine synthetase family protein [Spirochaeta isovalerica]MBB6481379.1 glutamine synthetase [Spirochaeta isovalerica]
MIKHKISKYLGKPASGFTKADIIKYMSENSIEMLNFRYVGGDGKLKTLNFVVNDLDYLEEILTTGERVDGSSLFTHIDAESSDLYVVPRYRTAFVNPFATEPTVDILCSFYTAEGKPLPGAPEELVRKSQAALRQETGLTLEALGELEFYLFSEVDDIYSITPQKGYHESHPFSKWEVIRLECMSIISSIGGRIKYGHAEVGNIIEGNMEMVQHEIEFLPVPIEDAADQIVIAKWVIREVAYRYGLHVSFAPKIVVGAAGSGMHIHMRLVKDGKNEMVDGADLSVTAKKMIGGLLKNARSLSAFGNTVPTSFLRLVPHQEAPTSICWGDRNRATLVRVPLGWRGVDNMLKDANPIEADDKNKWINKQTVELRSPDGSAHIYNLLAGVASAVLYGLKWEGSLEYAQKLYLKAGSRDRESFPQLPESCFDCADALLEERDVYEEYGVFTPHVIEGIAEDLKSYGDENLSERLFGDGEQLKKLVEDHLHCG